MLISALFTLSLALADDSQIVIRPRTISFKTTDVTLGDIAEFLDVPYEEEARLSKITLGQPPAPGEKRFFQSKDLSQLFRAHLNRVTMKSVKLQIPRQIVIEHPGFKVTSDGIKGQLIESWKSLCKDCRFEIAELNLPRIADTNSNTPWKVTATSEIPKGNFSVQLRLIPDVGQEQIYWVTGRLKTNRLVAVMKRTISAGDAITAQDVEFAWRDTSFATDTSPQASDLENRRVRMGIRSGDILYSNMLERDKLVRRGEIVQVYDNDPNYQLSLIALAEQDGFNGDFIQIRNRESKKVLRGKVIGKGEVSIE